MGAVKWTWLSLIIGVLLASSFVAAAAVRHVPGTYPTIQDAIAAADPEDIILVAPGTYNYSATIVINKPLTLRGNTRDDTLVQFASTVTTAVRVVADNVTIENIHLRSQASSTSGDTYVIDIPIKNWGPQPSYPEEFYRNFVLRNATIEGARRSLWLHIENLTIENTRFLYNGNRQAIQIRAAVGTTKIVGNEFTGGAAESRAAIIFEGGGTLWPLGGAIEISQNTVTRFSQLVLLNMGAMPERTDLLIKDNVIDHQDRSGSSVIFFAPVDFSRYKSIEIAGNTFTNPNPQRLAVYVDYSYGGSGVPSNGQIKTGCNTFNVAKPWGKPDDTVHPTVPVGFSSGAPAGMSLAAFDVTCGPLPVHNETQNTFYWTIQAAVDAANPGDVIYASPRTYNENVTVNKAGLRIYTNPGAILEGTGTGNGFLIQAANVTIEGFEIRKFAIGIRTYGGPADYGTLTVRGCYIHSNKIGIQIVYDGFTTVTIENCQITGNSEEGMSVIDHLAHSKQIGMLRILNCNVSNNGRHGLIFVRTKVNTVDIQNSRFDGATTSGFSGISFVASPCQIGTFTMLGGSLSGNKGCGLSIVQVAHTFGSITLDGVEVKNNSETGVMLGGGARCTGDLLIQNCTFSGNAWEDFDLSGGWFGSFSVGGTTTFRFNTFGAGPAWVAIYIGNNGSFTGDVKVNCNNFTAGRGGIQNNTTKQVDATCNWWGAITGGAWVSGPVTTVPRLVQPYPSCIASGSGDANLDGVVNILDVELVYKAALGLVTLTSAQAAAADVDGVPGISLADAQKIAQALVTCPWGLPTCPCCP